MAVYEERQISDNFIQLFERYIKIKSTHFMTIIFMSVRWRRWRKKCRTTNKPQENNKNNNNNKCNMKGKEMHTGKNVPFHLLFMSYRSHCHYLLCTILLFSIHFFFAVKEKKNNIIFSSFFPQLEYTLSSPLSL